MTLVLFYLHEKSTKGCYKPLPVGENSFLVFNDAYNQQNMLSMELYNRSRCNIYIIPNFSNHEHHNAYWSVITFLDAVFAAYKIVETTNSILLIGAL